MKEVEFLRLTKLMQLTSSDNDYEALAALRKANLILGRSNFSWSEFISPLSFLHDGKTPPRPRKKRKARPVPKSEFTPLGHDSPMPFGKYGPRGEGLSMAEVPAEYLHWLWRESGFANFGRLVGDSGSVADYIRRNLVALENEYPIGAWK